MCLLVGVSMNADELWSCSCRPGGLRDSHSLPEPSLSPAPATASPCLGSWLDTLGMVKSEAPAEESPGGPRLLVEGAERCPVLLEVRSA